MEDWMQTIVTVVASVGASSGFWAYMTYRAEQNAKKDGRQDATVRLLLGLAHDRIVYLGMGYIERGWITKDEYEDFMKYLYHPYTEFGGNGLAERVMNDVKKLPMRNATPSPVTIIKEYPSDRSRRN